MDENGNDDPRQRIEEIERFSALMEQVREGSQEAAEQIWQKYGPYVVHVVRRSMQQNMRSQFDSQDFAQAAWASFFGNLPDASQLETPAALASFLARIARHKVIEEHRKLRGKERNHKRELPLEPLEGTSAYIDKRLPTPSQEAVAEELVEQLTAEQPSQYGRIVQMRLEGLRAVEIAERERTTTRTVRRVLAHLTRLFKRRWREWYE